MKQKRWFDSIKVKLLALIVAITLIPISFLGFLSIRSTSTALQTSGIERAKNEVSSVTQEALAKAGQLESEILILSKFEAIQGIVRAQDNYGFDLKTRTPLKTWTDRLQTIFFNYVNLKEYYLTIRYLDKTGKELVLVKTAKKNFTSKQLKPETISKVMEMSNGEIFISLLDLLRRDGKLITPYEPVLQYATPIYVDKQAKGIVVMEITANFLLEKFQKRTESSFFSAIDPQGFYIAHPDPEKQWQSIRSENSSFLTDYSKEIVQRIRAVNTGKNESHTDVIPDYEGQLLVIQPLFFDSRHKNRYWIIVQSVNRDFILSGVQDFTMTFFTIVSILLILSIGIGFLFSMKLTNRIHDVVERIRDIAEGEGDLTSRINSPVHDELGELCEWFNLFIDNIKHIIVGVKDNATSLASCTSELAVTIQEVKKTIDHIAKDTDEESHSVHQSVTTIEEMAASIKNITNQIMEIKNITNKAEGYGEEGNEAIQHTNQSLHEIDESSKKIESFINVITEIATQTNLLSLNAAIEAAKAGEFGKGFSIVADEVRNLAERSSNSVVDIQKMIEVSINNVEDGSRVILKTGTILEHIIEQVQLIYHRINDLSTIMIEQDQAIQGIAKFSTEISGISEANALAVNELSTTANTIVDTTYELNQISEKMESQVSRFRTE